MPVHEGALTQEKQHRENKSIASQRFCFYQRKLCSPHTSIHDGILPSGSRPCTSNLVRWFVAKAKQRLARLKASLDPGGYTAKPTSEPQQRFITQSGQHSEPAPPDACARLATDRRLLSIGELPGQRKPIRRGVLWCGEPLTHK